MIARHSSPPPRDVQQDLAEILQDCVQDGASVGFVRPFTVDAARAYWTASVFPTLRDGRAELFTASASGRTAGTVQLICAAMPNQPHRADVAKLLVHPEARRQGFARALMQALEDRARALGRRLLVLDTRSGDPSQALYQSIGYRVAGEIPGYCLNPATGAAEPTTYLYKPLE
jgi:ribosomal protein S18 acetylase RimI-like enzyme